MSANVNDIIKYATTVVPAVWGKIISNGTVRSDDIDGNVRTIKGKVSRSILTSTERKYVLGYGEMTQYIFASDIQAGAITDDIIPTEKEITFTKNGRKLSVKIFKTIYSDYLFTITVTK